MCQHDLFVQHSCVITRRDGAFLIEALRLQTWKYQFISLILPNILPKLFELGTIYNWHQPTSGGGRFRKKLTNDDQKLGLGDGGLVKVDINKMAELLEDQHTEKQAEC